MSAGIAHVRRGVRPAVFVLACLWLARCAPQSPACLAIEAVPVVLSQPGDYCLVGDLQSSDLDTDGIVIAANDIDIDLRGFELRGPGGPEVRGSGIHGMGRSRIVVHDGRVSGFMNGVWIGDVDYGPLRDRRADAVSRITVKDMTLVGNAFRGIRVEAVGAAVERNLVIDTGGTTVHDDAFAMGIEIFGPGCRVTDNRILDTHPVGVGEGVGISLSDFSEGCAVLRNRVVNRRVPFLRRTFGIWTGSQPVSVAIAGNFVQHYTHAIGSAPQVELSRNTFLGIGCLPDARTLSRYSSTSNVFLLPQRDCPDRVEAFEQAARAGDPRAQFRLGLAYLHAVPTRPDDAIRWLQRAESQGIHEATRWLRVAMTTKADDPSRRVPSTSR